MVHFGQLSVDPVLLCVGEFVLVGVFVWVCLCVCGCVCVVVCVCVCAVTGPWAFMCEV